MVEIRNKSKASCGSSLELPYLPMREHAVTKPTKHGTIIFLI